MRVWQEERTRRERRQRQRGANLLLLGVSGSGLVILESRFYKLRREPGVRVLLTLPPLPPPCGSQHPSTWALYFRLSGSDTPASSAASALTLTCLPLYPSLIKIRRGRRGGAHPPAAPHLHVVDVIVLGWCSWSETTGLKAGGHLGCLLRSSPRCAPRSRALFLVPTSCSSPRSAPRPIVFSLVRLLDTVPRGPSKQLGKYLPIARAEMMIMSQGLARPPPLPRRALIGIQILQRGSARNPLFALFNFAFCELCNYAAG